jgi:hypothetical protein
MSDARKSDTVDTKPVDSANTQVHAVTKQDLDPKTKELVHEPDEYDYEHDLFDETLNDDSTFNDSHLLSSGDEDSDDTIVDKVAQDEPIEQILENYPIHPRRILKPLIMVTIQSITPNLYYGKDGEDATAHYYSFMDWITEIINTNPGEAAPTEATRIAMFKLTLRGEARKWIENLAFTTLDNLKTAFKDRFGKEPMREQDIESIAKNKLQPGEPISKYSDRLTQTAARLNFPMEFTRDWFQSGLPIQMQLYVKGAAPATLKDAVKRAKEYERLCKSKAEPVSSNVQFNIQDQ